MIHIEESILINRPIEEVFAFMSETKNLPLWQTDVLEAQHAPEGPVQVGTKMTLVRAMMGRKMEGTADIVEFEPPTRYAYKTTSGPAVTGVNTCEATAEGTKFTTRFEMQTGGLFSLADPLVARTIKRSVESGLANLKDLLESRAGVVTS
jgi:uncharacterized protein YndB with AHSA1/START domain